MDRSDTRPATRPWYLTSIWPMVMGIPALTVVAGVSTVVIANHRADPLIDGGERPDIAAAHASPAADRLARTRQMAGALSLAGRTVTVELSGSGALPSTVTVVLAHASRETYDQVLRAEQMAPGSYRAALPELPHGHWYAEVAPGGRDWRLTGQFDEGAPRVTLAPYPVVP
jgi:uncharacterized protein